MGGVYKAPGSLRETSAAREGGRMGPALEVDERNADRL